MQLLTWILAALAGAAVTVPLIRLRHARRRRLAALALRRGWTYSPDDPWGLPARLSPSLVGTFGHDRRASDVFTIPTSQGVLWVACFSRQMGAGRRRRTERYALVMASCRQTFGGIAVLPADQALVPAGRFACYKPVELPERAVAAGLSAWAERAASERAVIVELAQQVRRLGRSAAAEVRGRTAVIYRPMDRSASEQAYLEMAEAGRRLVHRLASIASDEPADTDLIPRAGRENR